MHRAGIALLAAALLASAAGAQQPQVATRLRGELPGLVATYKALHAAPELSHQEAKTSAFVATRLRALGYSVTEHVGTYAGHPEWTGYGVVAVMKNGPGPTLLVRTELDALPVEEETGLPYASHVTAKNDAGQAVSVMHACGHDIHITSLLGTAAALASMKGQWRGTLMFIGQPAEETINGAQAMLADGLYDRFPKPDFAIALHDSPDVAAGDVATTSGYAMASATSVDITLFGISAHGSEPEAGKDPVVAAAQLVLALQTIVSREQSPFDPAVVTVGSLQAGSKNNIIPAQARLQLTVRTYSEESRHRILDSITRMAQGIAQADGLPRDHPPAVAVTEYTPAMYNDPALTARLARAFAGTLGAEHVRTKPPIMASEDFGFFGLPGHQIPICQFTLGATDPARLADSLRTGIALPSLHSSLFAPVPEPTIATGVTAMSAAILELLH